MAEKSMVKDNSILSPVPVNYFFD